MSFTSYALLVALISADPKGTVIVKVDNAVISSADVDFAAAQQGLVEQDRAAAEPKLIEQLIDRQLIRAFLASKKIEPASEELQFQIAKAQDAIRKYGDDPHKLLVKIGYTPDRLKSVLALPLAWHVYSSQTITAAQIKEYSDKHKQEIDGTQLRASQIFLKADKSNEAAIAAKKMKLADLKRDILSKKQSFADAAKQFSEAPSRDAGGDVELFGWKGKLPPAVSQAAFALKVGEISEPIVSPFGVHLIQVTERHEGQLSPEDIRPIIIDRLSQQLWIETVAKLRSTAKIEFSHQTKK